MTCQMIAKVCVLAHKWLDVTAGIFMAYRSKFFGLRLSRCWYSLTEYKFVIEVAPELEGDKSTAETRFGLH